MRADMRAIGVVIISIALAVTAELTTDKVISTSQKYAEVCNDTSFRLDTGEADLYSDAHPLRILALSVKFTDP